MKQGVFLRALASDATEAVIDIVGVIGWEVAYQQMRDMLRAIPENVKKVVFEVYSPGGDVWEGNGIVQEIGELGKRAETVARVQVAASMATLIAAACQKRTIASNGRWLIHNAWTQTMGDADAHEKAAQTLRDAEHEAAKFYAERTGGKPEDMLKLMSEERWLMPEETKALGFVQEICDPFKPEEYEAVKQEIVAAGKWPQALVEMPPKEEPKNAPDNAVSKPVAAPVAPVVADAPAQPADVATPVVVAEVPEAEILAAEYERGKADGIVIGKAEGLTLRHEEFEKQAAHLARVEAEARKHQGAADKLAAQLAAAQKASDERAAMLRKEIEAVNEKLRKFVSGAMTFSPTVETWAEAMAACGGDYGKAAEKYPELLKQYRANETNKTGRK